MEGGLWIRSILRRFSTGLFFNNLGERKDTQLSLFLDIPSVG